MSSVSNQAVTPAAPGTPSLRWVLAGLSMSMLLSSMGTSIANVGLPALAEAFGASFRQVQWIVIAYLLAITTLIVGIGRLGDMLGRRWLLLAGIALFTAASALCGAAPSLGLLISARVLQGLGAAAMMALTMALVGETIPRERTGSAMGLLGTMSAIGTALGPSLGGVLLSGYGWRAIFLVSVPLGVLTFALVRKNLPAGNPGSASGKKEFDVLGTALLALALAAYALSMTYGRDHFGLTNALLLAAAGIGAALFIVVEARTATPLVRPAMFRNTVLSTSLIANMLVATVMMATLVAGPFYLSLALGLEAATVGMVMSLGPTLSAVSGVLAGRLVDRLGATAMVAIGLATMVFGAIGLGFLPGVFGLAGFVAAMVVLTPGYQLFQAANNTLVMEDVRPESRGLVSGMLNLSRNLGLVSGASVMGAAFAYGSSAPDIALARPQAIEAGMRFTFGIAAVLVAGALFLVIAVRLKTLLAKRNRFSTDSPRTTPKA